MMFGHISSNSEPGWLFNSLANMRFWVAPGTVGTGTVGNGTVAAGTVGTVAMALLAMALLAIGARFSLFNWNGRSCQRPDPGQMVTCNVLNWPCVQFSVQSSSSGQ